MRVSDTNKNRGAHGDSSFKLGGMPSSSENHPALAVGSVKTKVEIAPVSGFDVDPAELSGNLKPHQKDAIVWALKTGRPLC